MLEQMMEDLKAAGYRWAVAWNGSEYVAAVGRDAAYIGDDLAGPYAATGATPAEALENARREREHG